MITQVNAVYYWQLFRKWWRIIAVVVCISVIFSFVSSVMRSVTYVSRVKILLQGSGGGGTQTGGPSMIRLLGLQEMGVTERDTINAILSSRRMAKDIRDYFQSEDKPIWWRIEPFPATGGLAFEVRGPSPELTRDIANFCVENLDNINAELNLTPSRPMVKVLDPAELGTPIDRQIKKRVVIAGIFSFVMMCFFIALADYIKRVKKI